MPPLRVVIATKLGTQLTDYDQRALVVQGQIAVEIQCVDPNMRNAVQPGLFTAQLCIDDKPVGQPQPVATLPATLTLDTTQIPEGTHALSIQPSGYASTVFLVPFPIIIVVDNDGAPVTGPQTIPVAPWWRWRTGYQYPYWDSPKCAHVQYPGTPPPAQPCPMPATTATPFNTVLPAGQLYAESVVPLYQLYSKVYGWFQLPGGHVVALPWNTDGPGVHYERDVPPFVDRLPLRDGPRGVGTVSAYITGAAGDDGLYFVEDGDVHARLGHIALDGTITTLAGWRLKQDVLPYPPHDATIPLALRHQTYEQVGAFVDGVGGFLRPTDLAIDPRDPTILYVADSGNNRIAMVDLAASPVRVSTYAGSDVGKEGFLNGSGTQALFQEPFSLAMAQDGTMYVADRENNALRQISPAGDVSTVWAPSTRGIPGMPWCETHLGAPARAYQTSGPLSTATMLYPFEVRLDSQGRLLVLEQFCSTIRRVDLQAQTIAPCIQLTSASLWQWFDVDRAGTCGPRDRVFAVSSQSGPQPYSRSVNEYLICYDATGQPDQTQGKDGYLFAGSSYILDGRCNVTLGPHYAWMVTVGKGALWSSGFGSYGVQRVRKALATDRVDNGTDLWSMFRPGLDYLLKGGTVSMPWGAKPALSLLLGPLGWSPLGVAPTMDELAALSDADLLAWLQGGAGTGIPRPDCAGATWLTVRYALRRLSMAWNRSGKALR